MEIISPLQIDEISTILPNTTTADSRQGVKVVMDSFTLSETEPYNSLNLKLCKWKFDFFFVLTFIQIIHKSNF